MDDKFKSEIIRGVENFPGKTSLVFADLAGGGRIEANAHTKMFAASTIKLFVMAHAFRRFEDGSLSPEEQYAVTRGDKVPSCGAITYLHDGLVLTMYDLITLMIILSDNTATNILIRRLGIDAINSTIRSLGMNETVLMREMFDYESARAGRQNTVSAADLASLLEMMYRGRLVSPEASRKMLAIMKNQQLNSKIPFFIRGVDIAHKTGEDDGITHDAAVVFAARPFILCMCGNEVDVPLYEQLMQNTARALYDEQSRG